MILQKDAKTDLNKEIAEITKGDIARSLIHDRRRTAGQNQASFGSKPLSGIIPPNILRLSQVMAHCRF